MTILCDVYRSPRHDLMYLYVRQEDGLSRVPGELLQRFGEPVRALSFELSADRRLAREDPEKVLLNLEAHGYHLQLPPVGRRLPGSAPE
ncbi:MAG: YcgL domain-containing protein [Pseudomonadales bacterium]|nr:YcgL domain-containing protein [Pseudomonadales bacterium]